MRDTELTVHEAGDGTISVYDVMTGALLRRVSVPDEIHPEMRKSTLGNTLLPGPTGQVFAWTFGDEGLVYHVEQDRFLGKLALGRYALNSWVYSEIAQKLVITQYDDPVVHLVRADLSTASVMPVGDTEPGMAVLASDGKSVFVADPNGETVLAVDLESETASILIAVGSTLTETYPLGVSTRDSSFIRVFEERDGISGRSAPMTISPDGRFLYICPARADPADQFTPLTVIRLTDSELSVISGQGIRFPVLVESNPRYSELYVSGMDETVVVDLTRQEVSHSLGPGRLTGFKVAPNGEWAAGVDVFYNEILVYDLQNKEVHKIPLSGLAKENEGFDKVPVLIDASSQMAVVADIPADQVAVISMEKGKEKKPDSGKRQSQKARKKK